MYPRAYENFFLKIYLNVCLPIYSEFPLIQDVMCIVHACLLSPGTMNSFEPTILLLGELFKLYYSSAYRQLQIL